jgi:hypothetical protein
MSLFAILVKESRLSINDPPDCYSHCKCLSGSGKRLPWLLLWVCRELSQAMIPLGDRGSTDQGGSLYICQNDLLWTTIGKVVYVKDSLSALSAQEDCI